MLPKLLWTAVPSFSYFRKNILSQSADCYANSVLRLTIPLAIESRHFYHIVFGSFSCAIRFARRKARAAAEFCNARQGFRSLYRVVCYYWLRVLALDKDIELQKIAVFEGFLQTNVNAQYTFLAGGLIGILVLVLTLFYEGVFDLFGGRIAGVIPFLIVLVGTFYTFSRILKSIKRQQTKYLSLVFDLISKVEKGEPIPSLNELEKKADKRNQQ